LPFPYIIQNCIPAQANQNIDNGPFLGSFPSLHAQKKIKYSKKTTRLNSLKDNIGSWEIKQKFLKFSIFNPWPRPGQPKSIDERPDMEDQLKH